MNLWYSVADWRQGDPLEALGLGHVGPAAEDDWEDGLEAPLRPRHQYAFSDASRPEESLPDTEALWLEVLERDKTGYARQEVALIKVAQAEREREHRREVERMKAAIRVRRRAQQLAEWRAQMRKKYPDDPRWSCSTS